MRDPCDRNSATSSTIWIWCWKVPPLAAATIFLVLAFRVEEGLAGFACASNPCYFGVCIDDVNGTFMCYCIDGYTGFLCQTNWDECWSNPCHNGGECVDGIAEFNCTCPSGYQGELCESNVDECSSNPCRNNGTCVDGNNGYNCLCPAGYLGELCETDVSVCNDTNEIRCFNGGLCIEGPGFTFNCICQSGWTGDLCDQEMDECASSPCRNGGLCLDLHANYSCACAFGYTGRNCEVELEMCGESNPCQNGALCLIEDRLSVCYCVPDYHGDRCQFQYDECQLGPGCKNGGSCIDGVDGYTCSCPSGLTGKACECLIINGYELDCNYVAPTTTTAFAATTVSTMTTLTEKEVPKTSIREDLFTTTSTSHGVMKFTYVPSLATTRATTAMQKSEKSFTAAVTTQKETEKVTTVVYGEITTKKLSTLENTATERVEGITSESPPSAVATPTTPPPETTKTSQTPYAAPATPKTSIANTSSATITPTPDADIPTTREDSQGRGDFMPNYFPPKTTATYESTHFHATQFYPTAITQINIQSTTQSGFNCLPSPCLNGGTCLNTTSGPRCICKGEWEGVRCEERSVIRVAAFSGNSHVSHYLRESSKLKIELSGRTVSPIGVILHSRLAPYVYMTLYLQENLLKFKFSCGLQTMLLTEMQFHINNGYEFGASVTLEFLGRIQGVRRCCATVRINDTLAMSGEQTSGEPPFNFTSILHVGGVPKQLYNQELEVTQGFIGCIKDLAINEETRNIVGEAGESNQVSECHSLSCLSSPCRAGSTCIDNNGTWSCTCPPGYVGRFCERSVCSNNPCEQGGTCASFPGSGFICLCPLGTRGMFCESEMDISHPVFSSSTGGLASFAAYTLPTEIHQDLGITFKFIPYDMEQISLMLFIGQDGYHGPASDHLAVSFIKGYVVLTWNLGSGPRRIFTSQPVSDTGNIFHNVRIGRVKQRAWLAVDNQRNVTGKSPGKLSQLNTGSIVFVGGHESINFSLLPHDLPLHTGFSGCLFDVEITTGTTQTKLEKNLASFSRGVGQCGTTLCNEEACENGGGCIHHGATYTCLCTEGWFGPTCNEKYNPCDSTRNKCTDGSTCVPLKLGYACDCPPGKTGDYCEIYEEISDAKLKGTRSYVMLSAEGLQQQQSCIDIQVRPLAPRGLLLYSGNRDGTGFWSLSLQAGILELRVSPGKHRRRGDVLVIKSRRFMTMGRWHRVRAGRYGRRLFLWVEGTVNTGVLLPGEMLPPTGTLIYIGGVPDMSTLPSGVMAGNPISFKGCVRNFASQWKTIALNATNILDGRNVEDCDGTVCGGEVCEHGGTCYIDVHNKPACSCLPQFIGEKCEVQVSCKETNCLNGGRCAEGKDMMPRCRCPIGWGGQYCEAGLTVESPHFAGNSYIVIDRSSSHSKRRDINRHIEVDFIYLNFTTAASDGMILWSSRDNETEFFGIGVQEGKVKVVWSWESQNNTSSITPHHPVNDGTWHDLAVSFDSPNITIWTDYHVLYKIDVNYPNRTLITDGLFFLGGFPEKQSVKEGTGGHFASGFNGCIQKLAWSIDSIIVNFSGFQGENIGTCDPFHP